MKVAATRLGDADDHRRAQEGQPLGARRAPDAASFGTARRSGLAPQARHAPGADLDLQRRGRRHFGVQELPRPLAATSDRACSSKPSSAPSGRKQIAVSLRPVLIALLLLTLAVPGVAVREPRHADHRQARPRPDGRRARRHPRRRPGAARRDAAAAAHRARGRRQPGDVADALRDLKADPDVIYAQLDSIAGARSADDDLPDQWGLQRRPDSSVRTGAAAASTTPTSTCRRPGTGITGAGQIVAIVDTGVDAPTRTRRPRRCEAGLRRRRPVRHRRQRARHARRGHDRRDARQRHRRRGRGARRPHPSDPGRSTPTAAATSRTSSRRTTTRPNAGSRVVNASLGSETSPRPRTRRSTRIPRSRSSWRPATAATTGSATTTTTRTRPSTRAPTTSANIVCVGASRHDDMAADFSNYGATSVDVFAPGYGIISTFPGDEYAWGSGTSMATPHVAGEAALLLGAQPRARAGGHQGGHRRLRRLRRRPRRPLGHRGPRERGRRRCARSTTTPTASPTGSTTARPWLIRPGRRGLRRHRRRLPESARRGRSTASPSRRTSARRSGCLRRRRLPERRSDRRRRLLADALDECPTRQARPTAAPTRDTDGVADKDDNCATTSNSSQVDSDRDGHGRRCDPDRDGDGVPNVQDVCPDKWATRRGRLRSAQDHHDAPADSDRDGVADATDACPREAAATKNGCPLAEVASLRPKPSGAPPP